jgi:hypothetical protein
MPPLPSVPKVVRLNFILSDPGADINIQNRLFMQYPGTPPTDIELSTFAGAALTSWGTRFASLIAAGLVFAEVQAEDLSSPTSAVGFATGAVTASRAGAPLGQGSAMVVSHQIARRYRGGHPRSYLYAGTAVDLANPQTFDNTITTGVETAYTNMIGDIASAPWTGSGALAQVSVSYFAGFTVVVNPITHRSRNVPTLRGAPVIDTVVLNVTNPRMASQRRRNGR